MKPRNYDVITRFRNYLTTLLQGEVTEYRLCAVQQHILGTEAHQSYEDPQGLQGEVTEYRLCAVQQHIFGTEAQQGHEEPQSLHGEVTEYNMYNAANISH
jgi:hypothetical protein